MADMNDKERLAYYDDKIKRTGAMTALEWDHYDILFKRINPEGYVICKAESRRRYLIKVCFELSTEDLQAIIDSRK